MKLKRAMLFSGAMTAIIVGVFSLAYLTAAASNKFSFEGRGIVKASNAFTKIISIHFSHLNAAAQELGLGKIVDIHIGQAKLYKPDASGKLRRITQGNIAIGDEISALGKVRTDDRFVASKIVVRNRSFKIKGTLSTFDYSNRRMTVSVTSSTYRSKDTVNSTVRILFGDATKFFSEGRTVDPRDITAKNQKVEIEGRVTSTDDFEASVMHELP